MNTPIKATLKLLPKLIKSIFSDARSAVISIIVAALCSSAAGILFFSKKIAHDSIELLNTPAPIWVTILVILSFLVLVKTRSFKNPINKFIIKRVGAGTFVFIDKKIKDGSEPWYCSHCYNKGIKSILQHDANVRIGGTLRDMVCPECKNRITVQSWKVPGWIIKEA